MLVFLRMEAGVEYCLITAVELRDENDGRWISAAIMESLRTKEWLNECV